MLFLPRAPAKKKKKTLVAATFPYFCQVFEKKSFTGAIPKPINPRRDARRRRAHPHTARWIYCTLLFDSGTAQQQYCYDKVLVSSDFVGHYYCFLLVVYKS